MAEIKVEEHHFTPYKSRKKTNITISDNLSILRWLKMKKQFFIIYFLKINMYHKLFIYIV